MRSICFAGHSAVFVTIAGKKVAIDPWLQGNPKCPPELQNPTDLDIIALTHGHSDHASDVVRLSKLSKCLIVATFELAMLLVAEGIPSERIVPLNKGGSVKLDALTIKLTHAFHSNSFDTEKGPMYAGEACGVILSCPDWTLYHAGDTDIFSDMRLIGELHQPHIALLPIGDRFTMGPKEAARAASMLKCKLAIPIHYGTFPALTGTYEEFESECRRYAIESVELLPGIIHTE